ncbi:type II secretion system protein GspC [Desulfurivibrio dismutans]|uniref:type II secretion system protein GspC n=1 Tax=Desulfurivibrio dismutans TaxID=1398908 RepID=UPI0023DBD449|nr:type II secretion system protein GspC [Desulfurivibrio alkaliphilus]MDF1613754.1 type II secretion system protein GspC [Desulfurivibrio alkaliphilus]
MSIFSTTWLRERTGGAGSWPTALPGREFWRALVANERRLEQFRTLCVLVLVIFLAQASARLVWAFLLPAPEPAPVISAPAATGPAARRSDGVAVDPARGEKLAALHLFGQPDPQADPEAEAAALSLAMVEAPETTLSLTLKGLLATADGRRGLAVIAERRGDDEVYGVGDTVPGNAEIEAIYPDRVLLRRAGQLETLYLEDRDEDLPVAGRRAPAATTAPAGGERRQVSRSFVNSTLANLPDLARQVEVYIHNPEGGRHGFRLAAPGGSDFLDILGLEPDDILYEVNGIPLSDAGAAMVAFEELRNAREIRLVFERDGQQRSSTIAIR